MNTGTGAITGYFDVAQIVLYVFWAFFAGLIFYLHRENKREGYPLESERASGRYPIQGWPSVPAPKVFRLHDGSTYEAPHPETDNRPIAGKPTSLAIGAPLQPVGNPMLAAIGPGAYALRHDEPDCMLDGLPLFVPMRKAPDFTIATQDPDPRGMAVIGGDGQEGGKVQDVWVDRAEPQIRYLEVAIPSGRTVMLPIQFAKFDTRRGQVKVRSILSSQFADVPALRNPDQITLLEEEKVMAYYGGGTLYATPARSEPFI